MHESAVKVTKGLLRKYGTADGLSVLDVGSGIAIPKGMTVPAEWGDGSGPWPGHCNHTLCRPTWKYTGLDLERGPNVDVVSADLYNWPVASDSFDIVLSGQTMEHVAEVQLWMNEIFRACKPGGVAVVVAPSGGAFHRHPIHCWLIMPDGMEYTMRRSGFEILEVGWLESTPPFNDCWGVGRKPLIPRNESREQIMADLCSPARSDVDKRTEESVFGYRWDFP